MLKCFIILYISFLPLKIILCKKFLFSVIIAIYNTGKYLDDSIGSVLNQTVDKNNIQIILVNDGSIDESEQKCLSYKQKYPKNILYIKIEHGGVSKARNIGIKYAKGKYINFLDADDKWDKKAFNYVLLFFNFYRNINIVGCRLIFFEAKVNYHPLDYKFYKSRVVNLSEEYNSILLSSSSSFFRYSSIKNKHFKEGVFNGEDTRFINNLLLLHPLYGLIKEAIYYYRKRSDSTSAIQNSIQKEQYYFSILNSVDKYLIDKSKRVYNTILPFIQFYLGYNILFRISFPTYKYLEKSKLTSYYEQIEKILNQIEDKYIIEQKILSFKEKLFALSRKYNHDIRNDLVFENESLIYSKNILININNFKGILVWRLLEIKKNELHLEGKDNFILKEDQYFYFCKTENKIYYPEYFYFSGYDMITMYGNIIKGRIVVFNIPIGIKEIQVLQFFISLNGYQIEIFPSLGWFSHIPNLLNGYCNSGKYILKLNNKRIYIYQYNDKLKDLFEEKYKQVLKKERKNNIIKLRNNYFEYQKNNKNKEFETWIINDKLNKAGDNGEYFFRFLKFKNPERLRYYFVIKKNCNDYKRLESLGNILDFGSEEYLNKFLISNKIISSIYESWVDNPFNGDQKYIRDLFNFEYIFIQHGIIKDDLSKYLNRVTKNFNLIITSSQKEFHSLFDYKYHYNMNNIKLTGLPRYDNLKRLQLSINKEKIILIAPTWRMYIKGTFDSYSYESIYSFNFNLTNYFSFYNNLINNEILLNFMKKYNYTGVFCLHPYFSSQSKDFKHNILFSIPKFCDYQTLLAKSSLLITDYSSIFFDFAYLKKPVIYIHFDYEEYRYNHYQESYFNYKKHGFGPICYETNCTISKIISMISKNCLMKKEYLRRIYKFFKYKDEENCNRLFLTLIKEVNVNNKKKSKLYIYAISIFIISTFIKIKPKYKTCIN